MSSWMIEAAGVVLKYIGRPLGGVASMVRATAVASLSTAEVLLQLLGSSLASDIGQVKKHMLQKSKATADRATAEADAAKAEARKKMAEAADAANKETRRKRRDAIVRAEKQAQAAKTQAEADAIRMNAETERMTAIVEGKAKLLEAISKLRQEGGQVFFSKANLEQILRMELPAAEEEGDPGGTTGV